MASNNTILLTRQRKCAVQSGEYGQLPVIPTETGATDYEEGAVRKMSTSRKVSDTSAVIPPEPSEYNFGFPALTVVRKFSQQLNRSDEEQHSKSVKEKPRLQIVKKEAHYGSLVRENSSQGFEGARARDRKYTSTANGKPHTRKASFSRENSDLSKTQSSSSHFSRKESSMHLNHRRHEDGGSSSFESNAQGMISGRKLSRNQRESMRTARSGNGVVLVHKPSANKCLQQFPLLEPTYQLTPVVKFACFHRSIKNTMHELLEASLRGKVYEPRSCAKEALYLAGRMKTVVKELGLDRYKIISVVQLGEKKHQGLMVASRSLWDSQNDSFVSIQFQNASLFCVASVFGVYHE